MPWAGATRNGNGALFEPTHWSIVLTARETNAPAARDALETLCRTYWYPLYAHVRRRGRDHHTAQDLTQEFFARLVKNNWLETVSPEKGRFRTFLLRSMDHLLANDWRDGRTLKRGGQTPLISLDESVTCEERFAREFPSEVAFERQFDRAWATVVLEQALSRLKQEFTARGKSAQFDGWKVFLSREADLVSCEESGQRLNMSAGAVSVAVHRMRERYGMLLRETVAQTLADSGEVEEELHHLFGLLSETL
jgi:RNA polymerase sigma-70 factor (ECF subfamily)